MVFDATAKAFSPSKSTDDRSPHASTSTPVLPAIPGPTTRPAKRRRITQSGTMSLTPTPSPAPTPIVDLDALDAARRRAAGRVMSLWESLAEKYARPIEEDDEIDILTGKICRDRGVLRSVSERGWKIGSFGEALEVEPLVLVSEGETETGASEADDEGEGEDDTEGEGVESTEEGGEDPLGDWSYDWQYRVLPPPRPELSPQDAEDLKEFLAAENAIRESMRKNGEQPKPDDDDIVYLGDSMHNTDGTLRTDETSDDEFASMVMTDNSTIRYMKHEDDADEVDDIEPMASILGALALGRTPKKQALHLSSSSPKDEEMDMDTKIHPPLDSSQSDTLGRNHPSSGPQAGTIRPSTETSSSSILGLDVDDDLIVIDSDSDDEPEQIDNSRMKPGSPSKSVALPAGPSTTNARDQHVSSSVLATSSAFTSSPVTRSNRLPKESTAVATTPLDQSAARQSLSSTKRVPPALAGSPVLKHAPNKPVSKRVLGESAPRPKAPGSRTTTTKNHLKGAVLDSRSATKTLSTPTKKGSCRIPEADSRFKSPNEVEAPVSLSKRKAIASETEVGGKPSLSQDMTACLGLPARVDVSSPKVPISAPTASSSSPARTKSPLKRRKKATVVEVVLPALRKVPKVKRESTAPLAPASSKITTLTMARTAPNERSPEQPNELAPSSERPNSTSETTNPAPHTLLVVRSGVESELGLKRKRSLDGAEPTEGAGNALESRISVGSMGRGPDPLHACCSPAQLGPNQPPYCSAHPQCHAEPHSHAHTSHSAHVSCSAHHHPGLPIYQHQHQHQHLHTHLPYPLPQLPYTANELTEAAMKLIHGLSTFHRVSGTSSSPGTGFWLPAAQLPFGFTIPNQAGPSPQALAPKLEEPSSQEKISDECIPSSQEHERKAEAINTAVEEKPNQIPLPQPQLEDPTPAALGALIETHTEHKTATTSMIGPASSPNSKRPPPEREMSVIDIDSDSDDELAICDAGAGSMRWEPPVKKEVEVSMGLGYERQPSPRKSLVNGRASSRTSPVKLKRML